MQLGLGQTRTSISFSYCMLIIGILSRFECFTVMSIQGVVISAGTVSQCTFLFYKNSNK